MALQVRLFLVALRFLTRLPTPGRIGHEPDDLARASGYFPVVGLLLGALAGAVWLGAGAVLPTPLAAGLTLSALLLLTGALHEDGLADCCDGLGGGRSRERALEIMRDSRIGAYGAAGLALSLGLRWAALAGMSPLQGLIALLIALAGGRAAIVLILATGAYARAEGLASGAASAGRRECLIAVFVALAAGALAGLAGVCAVFAALAAARVWLACLTRRLGGYTGDGLGAAEQLAQIVAFLVLAGAWR
ncbi:MAG: adenosylcobinamide-GDP ribazoletransferase [Paracoccaceae bacterium]